MWRIKQYIILCLTCLSTTFALAQKQSTVVKNRCSFVEKEAINDKDFWLLKYPPKSPISIVNDSESATAIAYVYVANLYGKKIAKIEQPYSVSLLNDSLWMVSGASKPQNKHKQWKGSFSLIIDKFSGRIVSFMHEK